MSRLYRVLLILIAGRLLSGHTAEAMPAQTIEDVRVKSGEVELVGSLYLPEGAGPFPAVVLIHGAEPGKRRGYARMAEALNARGIAALASDKRGVGDSGGEYVEAPDLTIPAQDMLAWVDLLFDRPEIQRNRIGVLGWSQGGWIGPLAASQSEDIAFIVSISGPGVSPLEQNIYDKTNQMRATGITEEQALVFSKTIRLVWTYIVNGQDQEAAWEAWNAVKDEPWFKNGYNGPPMMDRDRLLKSPRMAQYVPHSEYEPEPVLARVRVPMLAVFGEADPIVPVGPSIEAMKRAFEKSGNNNLTIKIYPDADHGIRVRNKDNSRVPPAGYPDEVLDWIEQVVK